MKVIICDGSSLGNPGQCKIGVVIWERFKGTASSRRISPTKTISKPIGFGTNNDAEWQALLEAVKYVVDSKTNDDAFIYSDSLLVVEQANNKWKVKAQNMIKYKISLDNLLDITDERNQKVVLSWLPRQLTMLADKQT